ncbi:hypothetical protein BN2364_0283 [Alloalcanivorax xenomutans]|nr:hypothetical protein BN2364_0283 [Alloalcanivorax xenomutans]
MYPQLSLRNLFDGFSSKQRGRAQPLDAASLLSDQPFLSRALFTVHY